MVQIVFSGKNTEIGLNLKLAVAISEILRRTSHSTQFTQPNPWPTAFVTPAENLLQDPRAMRIALLSAMAACSALISQVSLVPEVCCHSSSWVIPTGDVRTLPRLQSRRIAQEDTAVPFRFNHPLASLPTPSSCLRLRGAGKKDNMHPASTRILGKMLGHDLENSNSARPDAERHTEGCGEQCDCCVDEGDKKRFLVSSSDCIFAWYAMPSADLVCGAARRTWIRSSCSGSAPVF